MLLISLSSPSLRPATSASARGAPYHSSMRAALCPREVYPSLAVTLRPPQHLFVLNQDGADGTPGLPGLGLLCVPETAAWAARWVPGYGGGNVTHAANHGAVR